MVETVEERDRIVESIHDQAHLGRDKTLSAVSAKYYWPYNEICEYVRTCDQCQCNNSKLHESLHPIKVKGEAWHQVGMDLIGPLQETSCGNKYIMTLTDYYTKWAEAAPLKDKTAVSVVNILFSIFCRLGCPKVII